MTHEIQSSTQSLDGQDHDGVESQWVDVPSVEASNLQAICETMTELGRRRKFCISLANKQTNAAKAYVRSACGFRGDATEGEREAVNKRAARIVEEFLSGKPAKDGDDDILDAVVTELRLVRICLEPLELRRKEVEREMKKLTRSLPVAEWVDGIAGFGPIGLAIIVAESGNLSNYPHHKMLWKRLGLAPYEGQAYSTWRMKGGLTADEWTDAGYKPRRRAEIHACIADPMSKHQLTSKEKSGTEYGGAKGRYGEVYVARRQATAIAHPDWKPAHARMDALRIMTKALVSDLWSEWRRSDSSVHPDQKLGAAKDLEGDVSAMVMNDPICIGPSPSNRLWAAMRLAQRRKNSNPG
jgi:hypothetical protein